MVPPVPAYVVLAVWEVVYTEPPLLVVERPDFEVTAVLKAVAKVGA